MTFFLLLLIQDSRVGIAERILKLGLGGPQPHSVRLLLQDGGHLVAREVAPDGDGLADPAAGQTLAGGADHE